MIIDVVTLFPSMFEGVIGQSILKNAQNKNLVEILVHDLRTFSADKHKKVDAPPYGGGPGMVLRIEPIAQTLEEQREFHRSEGRETHSILVTPQGQQFSQEKAKELSRRKTVLTLICGRYEGFDERIRSLVDEEISGGDFVCLGGEVIAMTMIEAISRLVPNVLGNQESSEKESFTQSLLEFPQYTRPASFGGMKVPEELLSGNHKRIVEWREEQALYRTKKRRPDLL